MGETLLRRLLVIVLCASAVVALWIVADQAVPMTDAANSGVPGTSSRSGPHVVPAAASSGPCSSAGRDRVNPSSSQNSRTEPIGHRSRTTIRKPAAEQLGTDDPQPPAVRGLRVIQVNHDSITIRWDPVAGGSAQHPAIWYYAATLSGIPAGETAGLELTINWFNDDMSGSHFIRVQAVDADGHRGLPSNVLVVDRPASGSAAFPARPAPTATAAAPNSGDGS